MIVCVSDFDDTRALLNDLPGCSLFGSAGLTQLGQQVPDRPHLFIIEKELSWADGFIVLDYIRTQPHWQGAPIILLSRSMTQSEVDEHQFSDQGVAGYLVHPYDPEALKGLIQQLVPMGADGSLESSNRERPLEPSADFNPEQAYDINLDQILGLEVTGDEQPTAKAAAAPLPPPEPPPAPAPAPALESPTVIATPSARLQPEDRPHRPVFLDQTEELQTLRDYIRLQEQETKRLCSQLELAQAEKANLESTLQEQLRVMEQLSEQVQSLSLAAKTHDQHLTKVSADSFKQISDLRTQLDHAQESLLMAEDRVTTEQAKVEAMKEKMLQEQRRIRIREKELENKLELARQDAEETINRRNLQILELQRRVESLEFDLNIRIEREQQLSFQWEEEKRRLVQAAQSVRSALQILQPEQ